MKGKEPCTLRYRGQTIKELLKSLSYVCTLSQQDVASKIRSTGKKVRLRLKIGPKGLLGHPARNQTVSS